MPGASIYLWPVSNGIDGQWSGIWKHLGWEHLGMIKLKKSLLCHWTDVRGEADEQDASPNAHSTWYHCLVVFYPLRVSLSIMWIKKILRRTLGTQPTPSRGCGGGLSGEGLCFWGILYLLILQRERQREGLACLPPPQEKNRKKRKINK